MVTPHFSYSLHRWEPEGIEWRIENWGFMLSDGDRFFGHADYADNAETIINPMRRRMNNEGCGWKPDWLTELTLLMTDI